MMYPCKKCSSNKWEFKGGEKTILATCENGHEVSFLSRRARKVKQGISIGRNLTVEMKTENGAVFRKEKDNWVEVGLIRVKGGIRLAAI